MNYLCEWAINIDADTPEQAAKLAEQFMSERQASTWTVTDENGGALNIDVYPDAAFKHPHAAQSTGERAGANIRRNENAS